MMSALDGILLPLKRVKECVRKSQGVTFSCSSKIIIGSTVVVGWNLKKRLAYDQALDLQSAQNIAVRLLKVNILSLLM